MSFVKEFFNLAKNTHSYRKASMGCNFAAFAAGYRPKKIPTEEVKIKPSITDHNEIAAGNGVERATVLAIPNPSKIPIIPPNKQMVTASTKN